MADIQDKIESIEFSTYTKQEIKQLSAKQIFNEVAFDNLFRPIKNGLYDPALGISPYDRFGKCDTCGQDQNICFGHIGHIELAGPVYNPLFFNELVKLLKRKCFNCHRIRITEEKISYIILKLKLIKTGHLLEASALTPSMFDFKPKKIQKKGKKASEISENEEQFYVFQETNRIESSKQYVNKMISLLSSLDSSEIESASTAQMIALK